MALTPSKNNIFLQTYHIGDFGSSKIFSIQNAVYIYDNTKIMLIFDKYSHTLTEWQSTTLLQLYNITDITELKSKDISLCVSKNFNGDLYIRPVFPIELSYNKELDSKGNIKIGSKNCPSN